MSLDTLVSLALFAGALFLMMRFGCGAHMGHAHSQGRSNSHTVGGLRPGSQNSVSSAPSAKGGDSAPEKNVHHHGCC